MKNNLKNLTSYLFINLIIFMIPSKNKCEDEISLC